MLSSSLGSPFATYGNMQLGVANVPLYIWGAWEVIGHYQPPLTPKEEVVIDIRQRNAPEPVIDHTATMLKLQHEAHMHEMTVNAPIERKIRHAKQAMNNDDQEALFILM